MPGRKCRVPKPPFRGRRADLRYTRQTVDECLTESQSDSAEDILARLVALTFKTEHPELFPSAPAPK
jgi:hypothetical protein